MSSKSTPAKKRCQWAESHPLLTSYHDAEWGVPVRDDQKLFAQLNLEGAQAGLSWLTVLKKRERYLKVFDGFVPEKCAKYSEAKRKKLMADEGIIRNRLKINAVIENSKALLVLRKELAKNGQSFSDYLWSMKDKDEMSKALKKRGFRFVGPTICYAFMQAVGMVDDHADDCFRKSRKRQMRSR